MTAELAALRRRYAQAITAAVGPTTPGLEEAFAAVPREAFLPPGPWVVVGEREPPRRTPDDDPRVLYDNVSVGIDPDRQLFNGSPAVLARMIDALALRPGGRVLHLGAGLGYYSAVIGHVVGPPGSVVAVEIDRQLADRARSTLATMPWVRVVCGDGTAVDGPLDAILVNAGVTHAQETWLDSLAPGGRLILPLTMEIPAMGSTLGKGVVVLIARTDDGRAFRAEVLSFVAIYSAVGLRDADIAERLGQALRRTSFPNLTSLRRDDHRQTPDCWLHTSRFCLSMRALPDPRTSPVAD